MTIHEKNRCVNNGTRGAQPDRHTQRVGGQHQTQDETLLYNNVRHETPWTAFSRPCQQCLISGAGATTSEHSTSTDTLPMTRPVCDCFVLLGVRRTRNIRKVHDSFADQQTNP
ncbi:unnamed protein product, partial [Ectocarpus fasciculatus]